jgi:hypothetical protein
MSGSTPSPDDSGGSPGGPGPGDQAGQDDGPGTRSGFGTGPSGPAQPDPGDQTGFGPQGSGPPPPDPSAQTGYGTQAGYGPPSGYGTPGYAQPGPDGTFPPPPRRSRARTWFGIIAGIIVLAVVIAGVSAYILNRSKKWVLTAPTSISGLRQDTNPLDQTEFSSGVAKFKSNVTNLPNYGKLASTVSAIYEIGSSQAVGFAGLNGTFNAQVVLKAGNGIKVSSVSPGPHGGAAECARTPAETICQWSTSTTIGRLDIIPTSGGSTESISTADNLMIKIRDAAEKPAHGS